MSKLHKRTYGWFKNQHIALRVLLIAIAAIAVIGCLLFALSLLTTALWNWLMPEIFDLPRITQLQAIGLIILVSIFKGVVSNNSSSNRTVNYTKDSTNCEKDEFDEVYEKWWNEKGEASFNEYTKDRE